MQKVNKKKKLSKGEPVQVGIGQNKNYSRDVGTRKARGNKHFQWKTGCTKREENVIERN